MDGGLSAMRPRALLSAAALVLLAALLQGPHVAAAFSNEGGGYTHPYPVGLVPGDIVIGHSPLTDPLIPGYWTHVGIVAYYDADAGDWVIVEAMPGDGVHLVTLREFMRRYDTVAVLRVATTQEIRDAAVAFALQQLGKPYDYAWFTKEVYGDSYYCSELAWAAYKAAGGPDIDANPGWTLKYLDGVAPQEIYDDADTYVIYYHSVG